jgi:hypothetical protein
MAPLSLAEYEFMIADAAQKIAIKIVCANLPSR